jgi:serine/threonine-protein kinase
MGEVYRARDPRLKRDVALKILPESFAGDPDRLARFQRESEVLAALNHPHIAAIYGLEESGSTRALVLELVDGETLADRIARGRIPVDEGLAIARQVAQALEAAHEHGIIHRDLKPANIKVRPDGTVKVLDFGLAKALEPTGAMSASVSQSPTLTSPAMMTGVGMLLGTAAYMSPEQARGKAIDKRSDIWAFGCVLFEMLTGLRAFEGEDVTDTLAAIVRSEPAWTVLPSDLSPSARMFLGRCLHKDPKQRVGDIRDVRLALDGAFDVEVVQQHRSPASAARHLITHLASLIVGGVTAAIAVWAWFDTPPASIARHQIPFPADALLTSTGRHIVAIAPNGRFLVYVANNQLYLRHMDRLEVTSLHGTTEGIGRNPFVSPDGQWIGYYAGALKRIAVTGGAPIVIAAADNVFGATWTDDTILYGQGPKGIWKVADSGGSPQAVITEKDGEQAHGPQLLPGGEWVLFTLLPRGGGTWDDATIVAESLRTRERRQILPAGRDARYIPTGHLLYGLINSILAAPFDVDTLEIEGPTVNVVEGVADSGNTGSMHFSVAANGSLVYVTGAVADQTGLRKPVFVDPRGREEDPDVEPRPFSNPRVAPDGTRLALHTNENNRDIWIWHRTRRVLTRLTFDPADDDIPLWSSDGSRIVFRSGRDGGGLFSQRADGTGIAERVIASSRGAAAFGWTADGTLLIDENQPQGPAGVRDIRIVKPDSTVTTLLGADYVENRPALSPDKRWLAYQSNESGRDEIYVRPFPHVDQGKWQVSRGTGVEPAWSPDGRTLYYIGPTHMMSLGVEAGDSFLATSPVPLFSRLSYFWQDTARNYDIGADGRFVMLKAVAEQSDGGGAPAHMVMVENWFEELKRLVPTN